MKNYFKQRTSKDFKNSKQFWHFYSSSIKTNSDKSNSNSNITLKENILYISDQNMVANKFLYNQFFTTLSSASHTGLPESVIKINQIYAKIKSEKTFYEFKFTMVSEKIVDKFVQALDASSGPGDTDIPAKVIKYCQNFVPILTNLFNQCISISMIPKERKTALVTPLFKNKGDTTYLNNYRGISVIKTIIQL